MIEHVRNQIKKIRQEKGLSQKQLGDYLPVDQSTYSKIENGSLSLDIERLIEIAEALKVNITEFFPKPKIANKLNDGQKNYGYANKADIDDLTFLVKQLKQEITSLKTEIISIKKLVAKAKK